MPPTLIVETRTILSRFHVGEGIRSRRPICLSACLPTTKHRRTRHRIVSADKDNVTVAGEPVDLLSRGARRTTVLSIGVLGFGDSICWSYPIRRAVMRRCE